MPLVLNGTTGVSGVDGTAGTPALQGTDSNTGIVFGADTISLVEGGTAAFSIDSSANASLVGTLAMGSSFLRNRIINGDMQVYQRGSVAATTSGAYTLDRWFVTPTGATVTVTQSTSVVPTGFADSLNVAGAASVTNVSVRQRIESVNTQDLASGVQVTVSGRIYQSTGSAVTTATIALAAPTALDNYTSTTSAATTYTLPSIPNATWTTFSNTFTLTTSCVNGLQVTIALGTGLTTGSFNLTGVQLEVGSVATPFERRQYGTELMLCQRYLPAISYAGGTNPYFGAGMAFGSTSAYYTVSFPVTPRVPPNGLTVSAAGDFAVFLSNTATVAATGVVFGGANSHSAFVNLTGVSGLNGGDATLIYMVNSTARMLFTGCEL